MPKIAYIQKEFKPDSLQIIERTNQIIANYQAQGFILTLRQVYYQHVARGWIENNERSYKRIGSIINDARLAGLVDWTAMEDRTRFLRSLSHWTSPGDVILSAAESFRRDLWKNQKYRPEIWIEKDALVGIIEGVCEELDVPFFSCRGYTSQSEMWVASQRLRRNVRAGQTPVIFHFGDHDPSGIDMSRDIESRLELFMGGLRFERLALNMDQVQQYDPPPNPAKVTDSRSPQYIRMYGDESWELDALEPTVVAQLIRDAIDGVRDLDQWEADETQIAEEKELLHKASDKWVDVVTFLGGDPTIGGGRPRTVDDILHEEGQCEYQEGSMRCIERARADEGQRCKSCGGLYCEDHIVPEWHDCSHSLDEEGLDDDEADPDD